MERSTNREVKIDLAQRQRWLLQQKSLTGENDRSFESKPNVGLKEGIGCDVWIDWLVTKPMETK